MIQAFGLTSNPRKAQLPAVDNVSFEAHAGRVTALLGASGAGKTTVLRLMLELQQGRGITCFRGRPLHRIAHPSREVGVLLGDVPGHPARSVRGHLRMLCAAAGVPARRADEVLEVVGLAGLREERLGTLSRGMDRRLGLACALLSDPHTLVLDDPAHGLSAREARWLHGMLKAHANQGGTVLFATADPKEAARTADQVVTLDGGRLVADQEAAEFGRTRLRPRVAVRSPHAARLVAVLAKEARTARRSVEVVHEGGNRLSVYGSTTADVGEAAFRHGILVHQLADETGDMGPGAGALTMDGFHPADGSAEADRPAPADEPLTAEQPKTSGGAMAVGQPETVGGPGAAGEPQAPGGAGAVDGAAASDGAMPTDQATTSDGPVAAHEPKAPDDPAAADRPETPGDAAAADRSQIPDGLPELSQPQTLDEPHVSGRSRSDLGPTAPDAPPTAVPAGPLAAPVSSAENEHPHASGARTADVEATDDSPEPDNPTPSTNPAHRHHASGTRLRAGPSHPADSLAPGDQSPLPPPISVRPAPSPLRPLRYELRRAAGIGTGFVTCGAVLVVSAFTAVLLARLGHTTQARLFAAWPQDLPLPPAALGAGLLGALAFGDEFRHPALAADRGTVPRRLGLLTAKLLVSGATALLLAFLTVGCDAELLYLVYGRELTQVPADWLSVTASWFGLVIGCAWAGVLAAGVFRSTAAGLAAVLAVPVAVVPLVQKVLQGPAVRMAAGFPWRMREVFLLQWPFGGERYLTAVARVLAQPVGGALTLSLTALLCAYVLTTLRSRVR
ncbi:ATP-binding cassette domain-containing protein [Streptomyces sp. NPDC047082]|uniref:ATP-binding cassette domain-containing protein n=1 Tax=Streptomyces sp. NPDC047082 TaxID=3155259 RepID=UPI0033CB9CC8